MEHLSSTIEELDERILELKQGGVDSTPLRASLAQSLYDDSISIDYSRGTAYGLLYIGYVDRLRAMHGVAEQRLREGLKIAEEHCDDADVGCMLLGLGGLLVDLNQREEAVTRLQLASILFHKSGYPVGEARAFQLLSAILLKAGEVEQAIYNARQSLILFSNIPDENGIAFSFALLGAAHLRADELDRALEYFRLALRYFSEFESLLNIAMLNANIAEVHMKRGDHDMAADQLNSALAFIDPSEYPYQAAMITLTKFENYRRSGKLDLAESALSSAYRIAEETGSQAIQEMINRQESKAKTEAS